MEVKDSDGDIWMNIQNWSICEHSDCFPFEWNPEHVSIWRAVVLRLACACGRSIRGVGVASFFASDGVLPSPLFRAGKGRLDEEV